jgi:sensor histidine kinase regulating citrate/malate metabolism
MKYLWIPCVLCLLCAVILFVRHWLIRQVDRRISNYQNDLLSRHIEEVEQMYRQVRGWRHDYRNHIQVMKAHLDAGRYEELDNYLQLLGKDLASVDTVIKTGNVMVDAILNSKLNLAASQSIAVNAKATVPPTLSIEPLDICVIVGNLMDNAIEACARIVDPEKRFIRVYMGTHKGQFYISVTNSASAFRRKGQSYLSTKSQVGHGFGLMRIDHITAKYGGAVNRQSEEGVFATEILLPI